MRGVGVNHSTLRFFRTVRTPLATAGYVFVSHSGCGRRFGCGLRLFGVAQL
ncbi:hypothetical protein FHT07_000002 [Xanthomonas arboricola]|nr:hypothetical protein [Xanthomonas arboricola]